MDDGTIKERGPNTMTKKKAKRYEQPGMPIVKLDNVPGPEASAEELTEHYRRVQIIMACHQYDDVIAACHWCCDMEEGLAYTKPDKAKGSRMFCSGRCASAHAAYRLIAHGRPKPKAETDEDAPLPMSTETATDDKPEPELEPDRDGGDDGDDSPPVEAEEPVDEPTETTAPSESPSTWKPKGLRVRKPRKAKAKKPERADGKCAKGIHQMDEANRYEYKGTVWCRECRKASRAQSKNGNGKSK